MLKTIYNDCKQTAPKLFKLANSDLKEHTMGKNMHALYYSLERLLELTTRLGETLKQFEQLQNSENTAEKNSSVHFLLDEIEEEKTNNIITDKQKQGTIEEILQMYDKPSPKMATLEQSLPRSSNESRISRRLIFLKKF